MNWTVKLLSLLISLLMANIDVNAQQKFESERRLKPQAAPQQALEFIASITATHKVKWYYEENFVGNSVEAKTKIDNKKYSIEFDTLGNIQDVEIQIDWEEIPSGTQKQIIYALDSSFTAHKINKIQLQYSGEKASLQAVILDKKTERFYTTKYEMIIKGRKKRRPKLYEMTFSEEGKLLETAEIIFQNSDNLEY